MKKRIVFFVFLVLMVSGAYAQNVQNVILRDGIYMTQGSEDLIRIQATGGFSNLFSMTFYVGPGFNNPIISNAGYISGNRLYAVTFWMNTSYITSVLGPNHGIRTGNQVTYSISSTTMLVDELGQTWTWRRAL